MPKGEFDRSAKEPRVFIPLNMETFCEKMLMAIIAGQKTGAPLVEVPEFRPVSGQWANPENFPEGKKATFNYAYRNFAWFYNIDGAVGSYSDDTEWQPYMGTVGKDFDNLPDEQKRQTKVAIVGVMIDPQVAYRALQGMLTFEKTAGPARKALTNMPDTFIKDEEDKALLPGILESLLSAPAAQADRKLKHP